MARGRKRGKPRASTKTKPRANGKAKAKTNAKAKPKPTAKAEPKPKAKAKPKPKAKAKPKDKAGASATVEQVRRFVLRLYRVHYPIEPRQSDAQILATDPNRYDKDPCAFYEDLQDWFGVDEDPNVVYFGGYGGKVADTIAYLAQHWDGLLGSTPERLRR